MPIGLEFDEVNRMWLFSVEERFTLQEVVELVGETDWQRARRFLWDLRRLREGPADTEAIVDAAQLVEKTKEQWRGSFVAILVERHLDFGVARMFQVYADQSGVRYEIFKSLKEAMAWLLNCGEAH